MLRHLWINAIGTTASAFSWCRINLSLAADIRPRLARELHVDNFNTWERSRNHWMTAVETPSFSTFRLQLWYDGSLWVDSWERVGDEWVITDGESRQALMWNMFAQREIKDRMNQDWNTYTIPYARLSALPTLPKPCSRCT